VNISATTYIDFLSATGTSRLAVVRDAIRQYGEAYEQRRDFYRPVREGIISLHRNGQDRAALPELVVPVDDRRAEHIRACIEGYQRWVGKKLIVWVRRPAPVVWQSGEVQVQINPELGIAINGERHYVKLYLKGKPFTQKRANLLLHLVAKAVPDRSITPALLDVRRSKLFTQTAAPGDLELVLRAEALSFVAMWRELAAGRRSAPGAL
jgi:hypothetical protein